ncbi:MAG: protease complex subunit PrcB family protein [Pyrinomonadaceae bacterium]
MNMKLKNIWSLALVFAFAFNLNLAAVRASGVPAMQNQRNSKHQPKPMCGTEVPMTADVKVVVEGQRAGFEKPFVAVAYDRDTYESFRKLSTQVPDVPDDTFKTRAVIAVFLGQRPTGGYGVKIAPAAGRGYSVTETKPAPHSMVAQVLSSPFKVVSVPRTEGQPLSIQFGPSLTAGAAKYRLTTGEFTDTGGIAGRQIKSRLAGTIQVMQHDSWITFLFDLNTTGIKSTGAMKTVATGMSFMDGKFVLAQVDPGTLIERPYTALSAEGTMANGNLSVNFESLPPMVADGFQGKGSLGARLIR